MSLELSSIRLSRGAFALDASLRLEAGETGVIIGPSGCGKTTLLRIVAGLERQDSGEVRLEGRLLDPVAPEKRNIGFVFQDLALFDHMSGRGNIAYAPNLRRMPKDMIAARVAALADSLRIGALLDRRPASMSGGERQRLAFARALASDPGLMLLDEPLSSLDASLRRELRSFLRNELSSRHITALHVTHDVEEALELADRIFVMRGGRIIASGVPEDLFRSPPDAWTAGFLSLGPLIPARLAGADSGTDSGPMSISTPFGSWTLEGGAVRRRAGAAFLHFPRASARNVRLCPAPSSVAAAPSSASGSVGGAKPGTLTLEGRLERVVFEGEHYRLVCESVPCGETPGPIRAEIRIPATAGSVSPATAGSVSPSAAGSVSPSAAEGVAGRLEIGSRVRFEVPLEVCILLPEFAEGREGSE